MQNQQNKIKTGLRKLPEDKRDFKLSGIFARFPLEKLPDEFIVGQTDILDQKESDYCTAFASCAASSIQEEITLNPYWSFAVSKMMSEDLDNYGQDLRTALKVHTKYGAIENMVNGGRIIDDYPQDLWEEAEKHKKQSFFSVDGQYDHFDNCRVAMFLNQDKKRFIITGALWRQSWTDAKNGIIPQTYENEGNGHAFVFTGWVRLGDETYLKAQLSNGQDIGLNGNFFFSREIVNKEFKFGSYLFVDIDSERVKKQQWSFWTMWYDKIRKLLSL